MRDDGSGEEQREIAVAKGGEAELLGAAGERGQRSASFPLKRNAIARWRQSAATYFGSRMPATLMVLTGPPLPGRWSLARALTERTGARRFAVSVGVVPLVDIARALGDGAMVLVDGDLARREERHELLDLLPDGERLLIEWRCEREQARREIFRRYASRPEVLALGELHRYLEDSAQREPIGEPPPGVELVRVGSDVDDAVARVVARLRSPPSSPPPRRARRALIVDDDAEARATLAGVLAELGWAVELAPDAGVALALLDDGADVELLISDQRMPGMSGVELARQMARRHPRVRTVLLTAYGDDDTAREAVRASAVTVLSKPLRVIDLERALDEF